MNSSLYAGDCVVLTRSTPRFSDTNTVQRGAFTGGIVGARVSGSGPQSVHRLLLPKELGRHERQSCDGADLRTRQGNEKPLGVVSLGSHVRFRS